MMHDHILFDGDFRLHVDTFSLEMRCNNVKENKKVS